MASRLMMVLTSNFMVFLPFLVYCGVPGHAGNPVRRPYFAPGIAVPLCAGAKPHAGTVPAGGKYA
jgi:hypothetical protein